MRVNFFNENARLIIILILALIVCLLAYQSPHAFKVISNYNSIKSYTHDIDNDQPILIDSINTKDSPYINLKFQFKVEENRQSNSINLFSTAFNKNSLNLNFSDGIPRVQFRDKSKQDSVINLAVLDRKLKPGVWHLFEIEAQDKSFVKVTLGGDILIDYASSGLSIDMSNITVGGTFQQSFLKAYLKIISLKTAAYSKKPTHIIIMLLTGLIFLLSINTKLSQSSSSLIRFSRPNLFDIFSMGALILTFIALALVLIKILGKDNFGSTKWLAHLTLLGSLIFLIFNYKKADFLFRRFYIFGISIFTISGLCFIRSSSRTFFIEVMIALIFVSLASAYHFWVQFSTLEKCETNTQYISTMKKYSSVFNNSFIFLFFFFISWVALTKTTNWDFLQGRINQQLELFTIGVFIILRISYSFVFSDSEKNIIHKNWINRLIQTVNVLTTPIAIITFLLFSFRYDTLFIPGSEYHWEYFVGVIQGVKNGGLLLWDTPSQYGFLNILLPASIVTTSPWQSFYIFQGTLLFIIATCNYFLLNSLAPNIWFRKLIIFIIIFLSLYFATPEFVGPYPYPSSSVVRFFCVYLLIYAAYFIKQHNICSKFSLSCVWLLSIVWSAESALYGTVIFASVLSAIYLTTNSIKVISAYLLVAFALIMLLVIICISYYHFSYGLHPDLLSFFEHATGYANGFGFVPITWKGAGNLLLIVILVISFICISYFKYDVKDKDHLIFLASLIGAIWGIATYYIGRPVPQNITAMLPLIVFIVLIAIFYVQKNSSIQIRECLIPIKGVSLALIFFILAPLINLKWYESILTAKFFISDISTRLKESNGELNSLLTKITSKNVSHLVYYGDDAVQPIFNGELSKYNFNNWLPVPLQLLEQPVSEERRRVYLKRYICNHRYPEGLLLVRKSESINPRAEIFIGAIQKYYRLKKSYINNEYGLYHFQIKDNLICY